MWSADAAPSFGYGCALLLVRVVAAAAVVVVVGEAVGAVHAGSVEEVCGRSESKAPNQASNRTSTG